jgi:hypothetical protein
VCRDFAEGTVVCVDGWLLSLTEARLYALASLSVWGFDDDPPLPVSISEAITAQF